MKKIRINFVTALGVCVFISLLQACTPTKIIRGNYVDDVDLKTLETAVQSKELSMNDVASVLGTPTTVSTFDNNIWYYIGQHTEQTGVFDPKIVDEKIIVIEFDDSKTVSRIVKAQGDRMDISYSRDETPTYGNDFTVLQNLLGNIGRFNAPRN